jgi:hypothetical protein
MARGVDDGMTWDKAIATVAERHGVEGSTIWASYNFIKREIKEGRGWRFYFWGRVKVR